MRPETPIFKEGQAPTEAELQELVRRRRMERQPDLEAQLDVITNWLYDIAQEGQDGCAGHCPSYQ